jgi:hypothetical protein
MAQAARVCAPPRAPSGRSSGVLRALAALFVRLRGRVYLRE